MGQLEPRSVVRVRVAERGVLMESLEEARADPVVPGRMDPHHQHHPPQQIASLVVVVVVVAESHPGTHLATEEMVGLDRSRGATEPQSRQVCLGRQATPEVPEETQEPTYGQEAEAEVVAGVPLRSREGPEVLEGSTAVAAVAAALRSTATIRAPAVPEETAWWL